MKPHFRLIAVFFTTLLLLSFLPIPSASAAPQAIALSNWLDTDWAQRRAFTVSNPCAVDQTDYQVLLNLSAGSLNWAKVLADGSDLRFTAADQITRIPFWIESIDTTAQTARVWVKIPNLPAAGTTLYVYYDNPTPRFSDVYQAPPEGPFTRRGQLTINGSVPASDIFAAGSPYFLDSNKTFYLPVAYLNGTVSTVHVVQTSNPDTNPWGWIPAPSPLTNAAGPFLLRDSGTWYIFYTDVTDPANTAIRVVTSTTSVMTGYGAPSDVLLPTETWEGTRIGEPYLIRSGSQWVLLYKGTNAAGVEQIGYATAATLAGPWTKYTGNPVIPAGAVFDAAGAGDPWALQVGSEFFIGYSARSTVGAATQIALAATTDWTTFTKRGVVFSPGSTGSFDASGVSSGGVVRYGADDYLFYTGTNTAGLKRMGFATMPVLKPVALANQAADVFDFVDEFSGSGLNPAVWSTSISPAGGASSAAAANGILTLTGRSLAGNFGTIAATATAGFATNTRMEARLRHLDADLDGAGPGVDAAFELGLIRSSTDNIIRVLNSPDPQVYSVSTNANGGPTVYTDTATAFDANWHTFGILRSGTGEAIYTRDGAPLATLGPAGVPDGSLQPWLKATTTGAVPLSRVEVDWVRVYKYCGQVTVTPGAQETAPTSFTSTLPPTTRLIPRVIVTKTAPPYVRKGASIDFTINLNNIGPRSIEVKRIFDKLAPACSTEIQFSLYSATEFPDPPYTRANYPNQSTITCSLTAVNDITNTVLVEYIAYTGDPYSMYWADVNVDVIDPALSVSVAPASATLSSGSTLFLTATVTNTGDSRVNGINLTNPDFPACALPVGDLDSGQSRTVQCNSPALTADLSYTTTATGTDLAGLAVSASTLSSVTISGSPVNNPPDAVNDAAQTDEDSPVNVDVLANDSDIDTAKSALTVSLGVPPANGQAVWDSTNRIFTYTPAANTNGTDSFTYSISDGTTSDTATVNLTVNAVDDAPTAVDDGPVTLDEDTSAEINVLVNDTDIDTPLASQPVYLVTPPSSGSAAWNNTTRRFTYTPNANFYGSDSFTYQLGDGLQSDSAQVSVTVSPVDDAPVANADSATTAEDNPIIIDVLTNDVDVDGDTLTATPLQNPQHGSVVVNPDKTLTYTPNLNYFGPDSFTYTLSDGTSTRSATVTLTVTPVNDAPTAAANSYQVDEDGTLTVAAAEGVLANDVDVENTPLTAALVTGPAHGTLTLNNDGSFSYTPTADFDESDSFTYTASDGLLSSNTATVTITVNPVNDAPVAGPNSYTVDEDATLSVAAPGVLTNDTDTENDALTAVLATNVQHGSLTLNSDGSLSYTPTANFNGSDSFTYYAQDAPGAQSLPVTVNLTVNPVNDAPVAAPDSYTIPPMTDPQLTVNAANGVLANDSDIDASNPAPRTAHLVDDVQNGTLALNSDGSFTYTPAALYGGDDSFTYRAYDGAAYSSPALVRIFQSPPTAHLSIDQTGFLCSGTNLCYTPGVVLTLIPDRTGAHVHYRFNSGPFVEYTGPITITQPGKYKLDYYAEINTLRGVEESETFNVTAITSPRVTIPENGELGTGWRGSARSSNYAAAGGQVEVGSGGPLYWDSLLGANQEAFVTFTGLGPRASHGLLLKVQGRSPAWYSGSIRVIYDARVQRILVQAVQPGRSLRTLRSYNVTLLPGDTLSARAYADGTVEVFHNWGSLGTTFAGRYFINRSGYSGIWVFGPTAGDASFDDFGAGTFTP